MKKEGGMVVNKNVYPPLLPPLSERKKKGFNPPTASQSARPHTKLKNAPRDTTCRADQQCPPWPQSFQNNIASPQELQQNSTSGCQITAISLAKGQG